MSKGRDFRLTMPLTPRPPNSRPLTPLLCSEDSVLDNKIDTDSDESTVSVLSKSLKRKLPPKNEQARKNASPYASPSSSEEETRESQLESTSRRKKPVSEWSVVEVKDRAVQSFGDGVGEKFEDEEIDGAILLSQTVRTEEAMEKLGLHTIGKKGKFLAKVDELSGDQTQLSQSETCERRDRLLTHLEKKNLTCEDKRVYNTKKKMVLAEINKEWPSDKSVPSFRPQNREEVLKLDEFVRRLTEGEGSSKFVFQKCGLGPNAIREMVMSHMRERRRKEKDSCVTVCKLPSAGDSGGDTESVDSSSNDSSPSTQSAVEKKRQEYTDYFHPSLTQSSCEVIILSILKQNSIRDVQLAKHLQPLKKLFMLTLLRGQDKNTYIRALASALYKQKYVSFKEGSNLANLRREDIIILKTL